MVCSVRKKAAQGEFWELASVSTARASLLVAGQLVCAHSCVEADEIHPLPTQARSIIPRLSSTTWCSQLCRTKEHTLRLTQGQAHYTRLSTAWKDSLCLAKDVFQIHGPVLAAKQESKDPTPWDALSSVANPTDHHTRGRKTFREIQDPLPVQILRKLDIEMKFSQQDFPSMRNLC